MKRRGGASPKAVRKLKTNDPLLFSLPLTPHKLHVETCADGSVCEKYEGRLAILHFWVDKSTALGCIVPLLLSQELRGELAMAQERVRGSETGGQVHWDVTATDTEIIRRSCEHIYAH